MFLSLKQTSGLSFSMYRGGAAARLLQGMRKKVELEHPSRRLRRNELSQLRTHLAKSQNGLSKLSSVRIYQVLAVFCYLLFSIAN
jgi:hypothetical protein